jgi:L-ascorbate metabolism protein UlaG (beta-lactamase superfamily)
MDVAIMHPQSRVKLVAYLIASFLFVQGCTSPKAQLSDHFDGSRFHNRESIPEPTFWEEVKVGWELKTKKKNWPDRFETKPFEVPKGPVLHGIRVLWIGHSSTLIQTPTLNILTDPVLFDSIGPKPFVIRTVTNAGLVIDSLPKIDLVLISHNHYDHLDLKSIHAILDRQKSDPPQFLVGLGVGELLKSEGISSYTEMDWDDSITVKGARVYFLEAVHTSRRGIWDTNKTLWGSFLIDTPEGKIYFAGDTAYGKHFARIYQKYGAPKLSLLPIGAYEPRWYLFREHMNPEEAVLAHKDLHSENFISDSLIMPVKVMARRQMTLRLLERQMESKRQGLPPLRWAKSFNIRKRIIEQNNVVNRKVKNGN